MGVTRKGLLMAGIIGAMAAGTAFAQPPPDVAAKIAAIGRKVDPPATAKIYAPLQKTMPQPGMKAERDIAYGPGPKDKLDLFTPEAKGKARPILIFVHGGAFVGGDKNKAPDGSPSPFYDNMMIWAVNHGLVGVNMNYELAPKAQYPTVQRDIAEVVAWARKNAASWGGDPNRIVVWGHSAGASHVGSFVAHPETYADIAGAKAPVQGAVMTSGSYDLANGRDHPYYGPATGLAERSSTEGLLESKVPLVVAHAELDPEGMVVAAQKLDADLTKAGRDHQALTAAKHGHMSESYSVGTADESVSGPVLAFIQRVTK
ncbi:MAG TPA: alpha/beta hydrolase [Caulobacteraceae bacterium]|jgi:triacylglycerol lipase